MYINRLFLKNIKAIDSFEMRFDDQNQAGWHVLIGDNGSGKSSIVRAIALGLIGPQNSKSLRINLGEWVKKGEASSGIDLEIIRHDFDRYIGQRRPTNKPIPISLQISRNESQNTYSLNINVESKLPQNYIWSNANGWFSVGFGPFRRFTGGEKEWMKVYYSDPRSAAHLSLFGEDIALTEAMEWLRELNYKQLEQPGQNLPILDWFKNFINEAGFLPHNTKLKEISSGGVIFTDGNDCEIDVTQLSDGFRSILSLTFELLRQLIRVYGEDEVIKHSNQNIISLPGIVLIDEIDAHLHPTWQTKIGNWFTRIFPCIQFIVTTHSPLICRAAEKGSIWRLATPGSGFDSGEVIGTEKDRLLYGNILDAYGTDVFGENVTQSEAGQELAKKLAELSLKSFRGTITQTEKKELKSLQAKLPTLEL